MAISRSSWATGGTRGAHLITVAESSICALSPGNPCTSMCIHGPKVRAACEARCELQQLLQPRPKGGHQARARAESQGARAAPRWHAVRRHVDSAVLAAPQLQLQPSLQLATAHGAAARLCLVCAVPLPHTQLRALRDLVRQEGQRRLRCERHPRRPRLHTHLR